MSNWRGYPALSRKDFESMLTSSSIDEAIARISYKPVGARLMGVVEKKFYDVAGLFKAIDSLYAEEYVKLLSRRVGLKIIDGINNVFDLVNALAIVKSVETGRDIAPPLPFGRYAILRHLTKIGTRSAAGEQSWVVKKALARRVTSTADLLGLAPGVLEEYVLDYGLKKIYGFLRDSILMLICVLSETEPQQIPLLLSLSREEFTSICRAKSLVELPRLLSGLNPTYDKFSEALTDVYKAQVSVESYLLALLLTAQFFAQNLRLRREHAVVRDYLLMAAESVVLRWVLTCLESRIFIEESRGIISKWWPVA